MPKDNSERAEGLCADEVYELLRLHALDDCGGLDVPTHACNIAADFVRALAAREAKLREALEPFAHVAQRIREATQDERWLEQVLFYMGTDDDPSKWSLTGRAFDRARASLEPSHEGENTDG